jgi:hypothetical protein
LHFTECAKTVYFVDVFLFATHYTSYRAATFIADYPGATGGWWVNVEMLVYVLLGIIAALDLVLLGRLSYNSYLKWSEANRRANELLRSVLTSEQYRQLVRHGYLDIPSPHNPECFYRVSHAPGLVGVIEQGRHKASLCLQPLEWVPDADIVVMHKLMIEADEETYLQTANKLTPI